VLFFFVNLVNVQATGLADDGHPPDIPFSDLGVCAQLGLPMIAALILFSQYLRRFSVPIPYLGRWAHAQRRLKLIRSNRPCQYHTHCRIARLGW